MPEMKAYKFVLKVIRFQLPTLTIVAHRRENIAVGGFRLLGLFGLNSSIPT